MAWIESVPPELATGPLGEVYAAVAGARGGVADVHRVQSLNPRALVAHLELYKAVVFQPSSLSRIARERLGVVVSRANGCRYCIAHHSEALARLRDSPAVVAAIAAGETPSTLPESERGLIDWGRRAASTPSSGSEADVRRLRGFGYDDRAILDAALTIAYFSFVNRLVLLLGVELEGDFARTCGATIPGVAGDDRTREGEP